MDNMEKEIHRENGEDLRPELNQIKEQIERERFLYITETFHKRCRLSVEAYASHHQSLAFTRSNADDNNGSDMLSSRMQNPRKIFNGFADLDSSEVHTLKENSFNISPSTIMLPFAEQLPKSTTWVFTNRNQLMKKNDSVSRKKRIYSENGEVIEFIRDSKEDEEETQKEKEYANQLIWKIGQEQNLDDLVVQRVVSKLLNLDVSHIVERYNELKKLKNEGNAEEASDSRSMMSLISSFPDTVDKHFCRLCLVFGCGMHETSQHVTKLREKKTNLPEINEDVRKQCSEHCYLKARSVKEADGDMICQTYFTWTHVERDLYLKGVEIFGKNSCLIRRNILSGLKTCSEIYYYMCEQDQCLMKLLEHGQTPQTEDNDQVNKEVPRKGIKLFRKKVRVRKSAQCPIAFKNIAKGEIMDFKHYTPCTCELVCGDQCTCLINGNCCEKYCGCSKICNNRFGGCNCTSQCVTRQCPCLAANRECDPDLCKSCCLSCGDGSLGETIEQNKCMNMNLLLKKHKRILLGKSDVHGWGAFTRDSLKKNEFIGEFTGELISQNEANERGKVDDLLGSSYLFRLNDQLEIDGRRKGNKLRFLNHSSNPNCYAKIRVVRGDHRIGIFANKAIRAGEELLLDYCYGPGQATWSQSDHEPRTESTTGGSSKNPEDIDIKNKKKLRT